MWRERNGQCCHTAIDELDHQVGEYFQALLTPEGCAIAPNVVVVEVTHIQILIHPEQKRLIVRPCDADAPDSLRWARGGGQKELMNRDLLCKIFAAKVFDLMGWDAQYRYKMMGKPAVCDGEMLYLFKLTDFELFVKGKKTKSYLPGEWREYFGTPVEQHEESYKIDLADGYIITDKT